MLGRVKLIPGYTGTNILNSNKLLATDNAVISKKDFVVFSPVFVIMIFPCMHVLFAFHALNSVS